MPKPKVTQADWLDKVLAHSDSDLLRAMVTKVVHDVMELEVEQKTGASWGQRSGERKTQRNGYRERQWKTRAGDIELAIPRVREGSYFPSFLEPRRRAEQALMLAIREAYIQGVSTRRVEQVCERMGVQNIEKSFVSRITKTLDEEIKAFTERPLEGDFPYVYVDARYEKVRQNQHIVSVAFLVAIGVRDNGTREVLGFRTSLQESHQHWKEFLDDLVQRGLTGVRLVISDAHAGLKRAIHESLPAVSWQRCRVHFLRNVEGRVSKRHRPAVLALVRTVFAQPDIASARAQLRRILETVEPHYQGVASLLEEAEHEVLTYMSFPEEHWPKLHSTNVLERLMRTLKARTRVVGIFPDEPSIMRLAGAVLREEHDEWADNRRYISEASMARLKGPATLDALENEGVGSTVMSALAL